MLTITSQGLVACVRFRINQNLCCSQSFMPLKMNFVVWICIDVWYKKGECCVD